MVAPHESIPYSGEGIYAFIPVTLGTVLLRATATGTISKDKEVSGHAF